LPDVLARVQSLAMVRDRSSTVWVGTSEGLVRVSGDGAGAFYDGGLQPPPAVTALFEDREGNLWTGGGRGIERLREPRFLTFGRGEGLPSDTSGPVYVDAEGRT
jgi:ligand-binding sensor domain-containing protein